jgi:hypothetical protein
MPHWGIQLNEQYSLAVFVPAGNLLDNKDLLDSLNAAKAKSTTVQASLTHSKELQSSLDAQREVGCSHREADTPWIRC